tara:strand:- start:112 stop:468 length:357 start_codon:yes stop_codon:yes gene_type:complete
MTIYFRRFNLILRHVKYICDPRNITIEMIFPLISRHIELELKINDALAFKQYYNTKNYPTKKEDYDQYVKKFCKNFMSFTDDEIDYYTNSNEYMLALNAHKKLNKVLHKSGTVVWTRN